MNLGVARLWIGKNFYKIFAMFQQMRLRIPGAIRLFWRYRSALDEGRFRLEGGTHVLGHRISATVISLADRTDRRTLIKRHLESLRINFEFYDAHRDELPLAGCADSHASVLSNWETMEAKWLMVLEDDIQFHINLAELTAIIEDFLSNPALDVLCLAHNSFGKRVKVSEHLSISQYSQTTAAYIVKARARNALIKTFLESSAQLRRGKPKERYALDILWTRHQRKDFIFAIPRKKVATQRASFSDIEGTHVDYKV